MSSCNKLLKRSLSRLIAVQSLYQYDFYQGQIAIDLIAQQLVENYFLSGDEELALSYRDKIDDNLLKSLISGVILALPDIDEEMQSLLNEGWEIDKLSDVLLPILRLAIFELKFMKDVPTKVVISEYVDLAACFYEVKKVTFVNGILQNIANKYTKID